MSLLMQGNKERTQEPTAANKTSSRSHAVLQVTIKERNRVRTTHQSIRTGKLFMIDLAGSERASNTKVRLKLILSIWYNFFFCLDFILVDLPDSEAGSELQFF